MQSSMSWTVRVPAVRWRKPVQPLQRGALRSPLAIPTSATATIYVVAAAIYVVGHRPSAAILRRKRHFGIDTTHHRLTGTPHTSENEGFSDIECLCYSGCCCDRFPACFLC